VVARPPSNEELFFGPLRANEGVIFKEHLSYELCCLSLGTSLPHFSVAALLRLLAERAAAEQPFSPLPPFLRWSRGKAKLPHNVRE